VVIEYPDSAARYAPNTVTCDNPGVTAGTMAVREARYKADGITTQAQAWRVGCYIVNKAAYPLRVDFLASFISHKLKVGSLVTLTTDEGLAAQKFIVDALEEQEGTGEVKVTARIYFDAIFSLTTVTADTAPATWYPTASSTVPDITTSGPAAPVLATTVNTATETRIKTYFSKDYVFPASYPWAKSLVIRYDAVGYGTATWASMAASEMVIPITGNRTAYAIGGGTFYIPALVIDDERVFFNANGTANGGAATGGGYRVIVKVRSIFDTDSAGVTIEEAPYSSTSSAVDTGASIVANPLKLIEAALSSVCASGSDMIAMDSTGHVVKMSVNAGAFARLGTNPLAIRSAGNLTLANGQNNDVVVGETSFVQGIAGPTGAFQISGIVPTDTNGQVLIICYNGGQAWTIKHNNASSSAANRIFCPNNADFLPAAVGGLVMFVYNPGFPGWNLLT